MAKIPVFGGEGPIEQPPYSAETITSRISTMRLEDMQKQIRQMRKWIEKAVPLLETYSVKLPDDDGLSIFKLAKRGKELAER